MEVKIMSVLRDEETLTSYLKAQKNIRKAYEQWEFRDEEAKVAGKGGNQWCWAYALRYRKRATEEIKESGRIKERGSRCIEMLQRRLTKI